MKSCGKNSVIIISLPSMNSLRSELGTIWLAISLEILKTLNYRISNLVSFGLFDTLHSMHPFKDLNIIYWEF